MTAMPARREFETIIHNRGVAPLAPEWSLAWVGSARGAALSGHAEDSRAAFERFLALWAGADEDIPMLREARAEHAALRR